MKLSILFGPMAIMSVQFVEATDLSPARWPAAERSRLEQLESRSFSPAEKQLIEGNAGMVSATVSFPDSAAFQQSRLASIKPGDHLPHEIIDVIAFSGDRPVLATASIDTPVTGHEWFSNDPGPIALLEEIAAQIKRNAPPIVGSVRWQYKS